MAIRYSHDRSADAALEAVEAAPRPHHRLLHGVLGLERRAEHPVAVAGQLDPVPFQPQFQLLRTVRVGAAGRVGCYLGVCHTGWFLSVSGSPAILQHRRCPHRRIEDRDRAARSVVAGIG